jgi:uncharacterized iron-regulated membrane protein
MSIEVAALLGMAGLVAIGCIGVLSWSDRRPSKAENEPRRVWRWAGLWREPESQKGTKALAPPK